MVALMTPVHGIDDLRAGLTHEFTVSVDTSLVDRFIVLTGDDAPVHVDDAAARLMGYEGRIAHGLLAAALFSRPLGTVLPGPRSVIQSFTMNFRRALFVGRAVRGRVAVARVSIAARAVDLDLSITDGADNVASGSCRCVFPLQQQNPAASNPS